MHKPISFCGSALDDLRQLPTPARRHIGFQLNKLQAGELPDDWKPMPIIGPGVAEIRERDASGAYRAIYVAKLPEAIHVLHVFKKKTQSTAQDDIALAQQRYRHLMRNRS